MMKRSRPSWPSFSDNRDGDDVVKSKSPSKIISSSTTPHPMNKGSAAAAILIAIMGLVKGGQAVEMIVSHHRSHQYHHEPRQDGPMDDCIRSLHQPDSSRDGVLTPTEYASAIYILCGAPPYNHRESSYAPLASRMFDSLPNELRGVFFRYASSALCREGPLDDLVTCQGIELDRPREYLEGLCHELEYYQCTHLWIEDANREFGKQSSSLEDVLTQLYGPGEFRRNLQTTQQCKIALAVGDSNRDDVLSRDGEYVRFVNQLSGQQFSSISSFDELPQGLQANYDQNAGPSGEIDISGSKPGTTATAAQEEQIVALCDSTISALSGDTAAPQPTNTPAPNAAPTTSTSPPQPTDEGGGGPAVDCTGTVSRSQCNTALAIADLSRDDLLSQDEYVRFINRLSGNEFAGATFDILAAGIQANFQKFALESGQVDIFGSKPGQSAVDEQDQFIDDFCCETDLAVSNPGAPTAPVPVAPTPPPTSGPPTPDETPTGGEPEVDCNGTIARNQCNTALSIADLSRDDLMDQSEYVRFVNRLANNEYAGSSFDQLPGNLQNNFSQFATSNGQIDIYGSKPGQTATTQQDELLNALCCQTDLAVQNPDKVAPTATPPSSVPLPSVPTPAESFPPTFSETFCRTQMASSDFNRDDKLNEEEYVRFLNRLTSNAFSGSTFDDLDTALQDNFVSLAGTEGLIDIFGSKPGQTADDTQDAFLDQVCLDTAVTLDGGGSSGPTPSPVDQPSSGQSSFPPTFGESTCYTAMAAADFNRDDYLNEEEFVRFLNRLTANQFSGNAFSELPDPLRATYADLASWNDDDEIYIFGSKPGQTATEDQEAYLEKVCLDVAVGLSGGGGSPSAPATPTPPNGGNVTSPPTFAPGFSEVYNSFIVSNTLGLTAGELQSGANRQGLDDAYGEFAVKATNQLAAVVANSRKNNASLRRRKLVISLSPESDEIYLLLDSTCPEDILARSTCQTVFGKFDVTITDEDPQEVSDDYTTATQVMISNGLLQTTLTEVDPSSLLTIVNASFPAKTTLPPTPAPNAETASPSPAPQSEGGGGGKSVAGPIVGGLFGGILLCAAIGYVSTKGLPFSVPSFRRAGKQAENEDGHQDDDGSAAGGGFGDDENAFGDEDEEDGPEQSPSKNMFGFGKKNKPDSDNQGFGDDDDEDENAFGMNKDGGNAFDNPGGMYAFDEPSEVAEKDDNDGSVGGNDDVFGAGPSSPGWGNSNNVFEGGNQGWGANGTEQSNKGGESFFGDSAFGGDENDEGSHSGSDSESYSSSEDSTYQSDNVEGEENSAEENSYDDEEGEEDSFSRSSADEKSDSYNSGSTPGSLESDIRKKNEDMEAAIASGDWDAVAKAADTFGKGQDSSLEGSSKKDSLEDDNDEDDSYSGSSRSGSETGSGVSESSATTTTEQREERAEYHAQVDALVRLVLPDETDKVDAMMEQFKGREAELVSTLQTMQERSANQRARAAVHKSKNRPQRPEGADGAYAMGTGGGVQGGEGGAAGTAAIAAASLPIPAAGMFDEGDGGFVDDGQGGFGGQDAFGDDVETEGDFEEEGSYDSGDGSRSQYSDEEPFSDEESGSQYSEERSRSQSYTEGSDRSGSQYSGEGSYRSGEGSQSYVSGEGSYRSGEGSQSYVSGEGSRSYISGEGSRSYVSGEGSQSHASGEGSQSYVSGEGSRSYRSGEGSQSYRSGEGSRSYISGEGSQSGDEEGSLDEGPFSDEGSQYSGEEGSQYSGEEGEGSYDSQNRSFGEDE